MSGEVCALCGRAADPELDGDPPLGWSCDRASGREQESRAVCPECTRRHVRSIEAKLEREWW